MKGGGNIVMAALITIMPVNVLGDNKLTDTLGQAPFRSIATREFGASESGLYTPLSAFHCTL